MGEALGRLAGLSSEQWGMVTAAQARSLDVSRVDIGRLIAVGALEVAAGAARVYRVGGAPPDPDLDGLRAAWLQLDPARPASDRMRDPDAVVAGRSAALAMDLGDLIPDEHEFYVTRRRQPRRHDLRLRVRPTLSVRDWQIVDGLPVCAPPRVIWDLLAAREDASAIARIVQDSIRAGRLDSKTIPRLVGPYAGDYGAASPESFAALLTGAAGTGREGIAS